MSGGEKGRKSRDCPHFPSSGNGGCPYLSRSSRVGVGLVESLVALAVLMAVLVPVLILARSSYRGTVTSEKALTAVLLGESLLDELRASPFPSVSSRATEAVTHGLPFTNLLSAAASRNPTLVPRALTYLEGVEWQAAVVPDGNLRRIAVEVVWPQAGDVRWLQLGGVTLAR